MTDKISLTASMRSNLLSLQHTQKLFDDVQDRLSTGKKVNSALDNPQAYFAAAALNTRASDLESLMDSMGQAVQTLKAADQGIQSLTKFVEQAKSLVNSALDASVVSTAVTGTLKIDVYDGDTGGIAANANIATGDKFIIRSGESDEVSSDISTLFSESTKLSDLFNVTGLSAGDLKLDIYVSGTKTTVSLAPAGSGDNRTMGELVTAINNQVTDVTASIEDGKLTIKANDPNDYVVVSNSTTITSASAGTGSPVLITVLDESSLATQLGLDSQNVAITIGADWTATDLKNEINTAAETAGVDITASLVDGKLKIADNLGNDLSIVDKANYGAVGDLASATPAEFTAADALGIAGNNRTGSNLRADYATQFDSIRTQINQLVQDTSYKGVNLLNGDDLTVIFNENRTSTLQITGVTFDATGLGITATTDSWKTNDDIQTQLTQVDAALSTLRSQSSTFGNNLNVVQNREDFTQGMLDTLTAGADKLTLADMNEEAANMLALQTRQQLGTNSLSLASQSSQSVLKLF